MVGLGDLMMTMTSTSQRMRAFGKSLVRDERGAVLVYVSIALTVFMGFAALVIDGGRLFTLNTEMQSAADALALAGAAELDGTTDAIDRADLAMANLVQNSEIFGNGASAITVSDVTKRYLTALPDDDSQPLSDADEFVTTDDTLARFVQVNVTQRDVNTIFAPAIGGDDTAGTGAVAVAGFTQAVCKFTPLFICNPYEDDGITTYAQYAAKIEDPNERRRLIELKAAPGGGAGSTSYFPGNFGFLESPIGHGAKGLGQSLGLVDPGACFRQDAVGLRTGNITSAGRGLNTRFDLYENNFKNEATDSGYRPAKNVVKGYLAKNGKTGNAGCPPEPDPNAPLHSMGMPRDNCFALGTCSSLGEEANRFGDGMWSFRAYWDMNHGNRNGDLTDDGPYPNSWSDANPPSRYDVYRWEIGTDSEGNPILGSDPNGSNVPNKFNAPAPLNPGENGNPSCGTSATESDGIDRRILYAAVLNCKSLEVHGGCNSNGGANCPPVQALAFVKMFVTQPMSVTGPSNNEVDGSLYVEMTGIVTPGIDDEVIHDIVQLYR
jgi:Flp pilus assembly protein TadG